MNYNVWIDLALLGGAVCILTTLCFRIEGNRRGAEKVSRKELERHQAVRRILMEDGEYH